MKESEWKAASDDGKAQLLSQCFSVAGLNLDKLRKKRAEIQKSNQTSEDIHSRTAKREMSVLIVSQV